MHSHTHSLGAVGETGPPCTEGEMVAPLPLGCHCTPLPAAPAALGQEVADLGLQQKKVGNHCSSRTITPDKEKDFFVPR